MLNQTVSKATLVVDAKATLGEGAIWHATEKKLYWIDIEGRCLFIYNPANNTNRQFFLGQRVGTVVPVDGGGVLVALQNGIHFLDTHTGSLTLLVNPLTNADIRFNDGKCDPSGRFWVGSMHLEQTTGTASLYRLNTDQSVDIITDGVTISNGIVWSLDKQKMYYTDSPLRRVDVFDYNDSTGFVSNRKTAFTIPDELGDPDGMTIDSEGKLWIAIWGSNAVGRFDPATGELLDKIFVPAPNITSCAFGGEDLDTLYITSAREGMNEEQLKEFPLSGGLFAVKTRYRGVEAFFYRKK